MNEQWHSYIELIRVERMKEKQSKAITFLKHE